MGIARDFNIRDATSTAPDIKGVKGEPSHSAVDTPELLAALQLQSERFTVALENIPMGLCLFDRQHRLVLSNRQYALLYGIAPEHIRPGMMLGEVLSLRAEAGTTPDMTVEDYLGWTQSSPAANDASGRPVALKNGRIMFIRHRTLPDGGWVATHEDITERSLTEAALRHGEKLRALGQMTGGIVHDMNNLLQLVTLHLELMQQKPDNAASVSRRLEAAMRSVRAATDLLDRMRSFARPQPPVLEPTDLNAWMQPLREMAARMLGSRYQVELRTDASLPVWPVDRSHLESALLNLILNARDAMPQGGRIWLETAHRTLDADAAAADPALKPGRYAEIAVCDNGPGMPAEVAARAFEPFFSTKPFEHGTGLGLSMVRKFAEQAGGAALLHTRPGEGTTVRLLLPER